MSPKIGVPDNLRRPPHLVPVSLHQPKQATASIVRAIDLQRKRLSFLCQLESVLEKPKRGPSRSPDIIIFGPNGTSRHFSHCRDRRTACAMYASCTVLHCDFGCQQPDMRPTLFGTGNGQELGRKMYILGRSDSQVKSHVAGIIIHHSICTHTCTLGPALLMLKNNQNSLELAYCNIVSFGSFCSYVYFGYVAKLANQDDHLPPLPTQCMTVAGVGVDRNEHDQRTRTSTRIPIERGAAVV